jgi:tetratricopeptide (TPR) repeat protein
MIKGVTRVKEDFGRLLETCRTAAGLTQKRLAEELHVDASLLSRFESGRIPNAAMLQSIVNALTLKDVPPSQLDSLWESAGHYRTGFQGTVVAHPVVDTVQEEFQRLEPGAQSVLSADIRTVIAISQAHRGAKQAAQKRRWKEAGSALEETRKRLDEYIQQWYVLVDEDLGSVLSSDGRYEEAAQYLESALWSARGLGDRQREAGILVRLGDANRRRGGWYWESSKEQYEQSEKTYELLSDLMGQAKCLRKLAGLHLYQGRPDLALPLCEGSLRIASLQHDLPSMYKAMQHMGWAYDMLGRWDEATGLFEEALTMVKQVSADRWDEAKALRYLGDAYRLQRRAGDAERCYLDAQAIMKEFLDTGREAGLLLAKIQLGLAHVYSKDRSRQGEAQGYLNESLRVHLESGEDFQVAENLRELGELLLRLNRLDGAEMRLNQACSRLAKLGNDFCHSLALATLCELHLRTGSDTKVRQTAGDVVKMEKKVPGLLSYQVARVTLISGLTSLRAADHEQALRDFREASERALSFNATFASEICGDVLSALRSLACEGALPIALGLCRAYLSFWDEVAARPSRPRVSLDCGLDVRDAIAELEALEPVQ